MILEQVLVMSCQILNDLAVEVVKAIGTLTVCAIVAAILRYLVSHFDWIDRRGAYGVREI